MIEMVSEVVATLSTYEEFAYPALTLLLIAGAFALPVPEDLVLVVGGVLAAKGIIDLGGVLIATYSGVLAGDSIVFAFGRLARKAKLARGLPLAAKNVTVKGTSASEVSGNDPEACPVPTITGAAMRSSLARRWRRFTGHKVLNKSVQGDSFGKRLFDRYGLRSVLLARFLPGVRLPTFFAAGIYAPTFSAFLWRDGMAALLSVPLWVSLGFLFGRNTNALAHHFGQLRSLFLGLAIAVVCFVLLLLFFRSSIWKSKRDF